MSSRSHRLSADFRYDLGCALPSASSDKSGLFTGKIRWSRRGDFRRCALAEKIEDRNQGKRAAQQKYERFESRQHRSQKHVTFGESGSDHISKAKNQRRKRSRYTPMRIESDGKHRGIIVASCTLSGHDVRAVKLGLGQYSGQRHDANISSFHQTYITH